MIVGIAGHTDHGKTELVGALTGIDTDRLPAEKARGIMDKVHHGDWVVDPVLHTPSNSFDAHIRLLAAEERPLRQLTPIRLHLGAARLSARIVVLDRDQFLPGDEAPAQVTLDRSIGTLHGDRFVPRSFGAADDRWENGARFLAAAPRPQTAQRLLALASPADPDPRQALFAAPFR